VSRPPLPGGPYLVVGLARSGSAAALALAARGEQVIGTDRAGLAPSELAVPTFLDGLAAGPAAATYLTSPYLEISQYPPAARAILAGIARLFPGQTPDVYALYGYEAMNDVLSAIKRAKNPAQRGGGPGGLVSSFFHLGVIHGVIGAYTISSRGDSSLRTFDGYRLGSRGALQLVRAFS